MSPSFGPNVANAMSGCCSVLARCLLTLKMCLQLLLLFVVFLLRICDRDATAYAAQFEDAKPAAEAASLTSDQLLEQQKLLASQFQQLEKKLFELYQMERESRPQRAELLRQMYELAQQNNTVGRMNDIVQQIETGQLRTARDAQNQALSDLKLLMEILQKEDESQRLADWKKRQQENLREVNRLLQLQDRLRNETLESDQPQSMADPQHSLELQTDSLLKKVQNDNGQSPAESQPTGNEPSAGDQNSQDGTEGTQSDPQNGSDGQQSSGADGSKSDPAESSDASETESQSEQSDSSDADSSDDQLSQRLDSARQRMKDAQQKLQEAEKNDAAEEMRKAIEQLEAAKKELESILKQAREEEMMSTLARLEDQFRKLLEVQLRINQQTVQMDQVPTVARGPDHQIASAKLAGNQRKNAMGSMRAAMVLRDDSSSIALAVTVQQMTEDMQMIGDRLIATDTGLLTQQFQQDVIDSLELLIQSVVKAQEDVQQQAQQDSPPGGPASDPGEMPLVDQIAELKMLKGLQERILRRHQMIADQQQTSKLPIGTLTDQEATQMLRRLEVQQSRLFDMTRAMLKQIK